MRCFYSHFAGSLFRKPLAYQQTGLLRENTFVVAVIEFIDYFTTEGFSGSVTYMCIQFQLCGLLGNFVERDRQSASGCLVLIIRIGDEYLVVNYHPAIPVNSSEVCKIQCILRFAGRVGGIVTVVCPYSDYIVFSILQTGSDIYDDRQKTTEMLFQQLSVHPYF